MRPTRRARQSHTIAELPPQRLLVAPHLQPKASVGNLQLTDDDPSPAPAALLIESRGPLIPDRAVQPGSLDATLRQATLGVGHQPGRNARPAGLGRDVELVELVALEHAESHR